MMAIEKWPESGLQVEVLTLVVGLTSRTLQVNGSLVLVGTQAGYRWRYFEYDRWCVCFPALCDVRCVGKSEVLQQHEK